MSTVQILGRWKDFPEHTMGGIINSTFQEGHGGEEKRWEEDEFEHSVEQSMQSTHSLI